MFNKFFLVLLLVIVMKDVTVVIYGISTEGYIVASQLLTKGATVYLIDDLIPSAILLKSEITKAYPNVSLFKDDEPLLPLVSMDEAVTKAQYLFFTPKIRKMEDDTKIEIHAKFKDAIKPLKKTGSVVYTLPTGFEGNNENISLLEHVTGFKVGKNVSYFYYPIEAQIQSPNVIGSIDGKEDTILSYLLSVSDVKKRFVNIASAEHIHAINTLTRFSRLCSVLEVCKHLPNLTIRDDLSREDFCSIYLDDMINGLLDLEILRSLFDGQNSFIYMINLNLKGVNGYIKRLIDEIRATLKKNNLKAARTRVTLSWTLDQHTMRGNKFDILQKLITKLHDYISDVQSYQTPSTDIFQGDKETVIVACSQADFDYAQKNSKGSDLIILKANPLCEVYSNSDND